MTFFNGTSMIGAGFANRESLVFNNQGGKNDSPNSKVYLRNKFRVVQESRNQSRSKNRSKSKSRIRNAGKSTKGRAKGRTSGRAKGAGLAPGGTNISAFPAKSGRQPPPRIGYRARKPLNMRRKGLGRIN